MTKNRIRIPARGAASGLGVMAAVAMSLANAQPANVPAQGSSASTESGQYALQEITVTARRVRENLQDTPVAVTAFQAQDIQARSIRNIGDAASFTPDFLSNPGPTGGNDGFFFIRGVGQTDLNAATDPGVATYVDGVYLGRVVGASIDSLNIAQIEVLRGPQGTFFGRNTIGGAINVTTQDPSGQLGAEARISGGSRGLKRGQVTLDLPITDHLAVLISGLYRGQNGWVHQPVTGTTFGDTIARVGRAKIKYTPNDDFSATLELERQRITGTSESNDLIGFNPDVFSPLGVPMNPLIGNYVVSPGPQQFTDYSDANPILDLKVSGASLTLDGKAGPLHLTSISAYRSLHHFSQGDFDGSPYSFYDQSFRTNEHQLSQEFRAAQRGSWGNWLGGLFFYKEDDYHDNQIDLGGNNDCSFIPFPGAPFCAVPNYQTPYVNRALSNNQRINVNDQAYAAYGNGTINFTSRFSGSLGLRWTHERKIQDYDFFIDNTANVFNLAGLPPSVLPTLSPNNPFVGVPTSYEKSWSELTPSAGLNFQATPNVLAYISYARGFKSGGFNGRPSPNASGQYGVITPYDPETLDSYEIGLKSEWLDHRVRANASAFVSNYKGIQLLAISPATGFFNTVNAARDLIDGVELELAARPAGGLQVQASAGWMHNEYKSLSAGAIASGIEYGNKLPLTPDFDGSLGLSYSWNVRDAALTVRGDYTYHSTIFFEADNLPYSRQGGYGLANARLTYDHDTWQVSLYGLNLTNKIYTTNAQDVTPVLGVAFASVGAPREWGAELTYRFGSRANQ